MPLKEGQSAILIPAIAGPIKRRRNMARAKYYSARLDRKLISPLYHAAILNGAGRDRQPAHVAVLADPEGNGPGYLDHNL